MPPIPSAKEVASSSAFSTRSIIALSLRLKANEMLYIMACPPEMSLAVLAYRTLYLAASSTTLAAYCGKCSMGAIGPEYSNPPPLGTSAKSAMLRPGISRSMGFMYEIDMKPPSLESMYSWRQSQIILRLNSISSSVSPVKKTVM